MNIPTKEQCLNILKQNKTPSNVIEHSITVCNFALDLVDKLEKKGIKVNKELVIAASLLHDVERVKDSHVDEGAKLLKQLGFPEVAEVTSKHTLYQLDGVNLKTAEEKIVFYADKRTKGNKIVSLSERFESLEKKYSIDLKKEFEFAKKIEVQINKILK